MVPAGGRHEELLVDGYNLLLLAPHLRDSRDPSLQAGRSALERTLERFAARTGAQVLLFYDGAPASGAAGAAPAGRGRLHVFFSQPPQTADDLLARAIEVRHGSRHARVITSDRQIRAQARRHRIRATTAAAFVEELERAAPPFSAAPYRPPPELDPDLSLSAAEVNHWEQLFAARAASVPPPATRPRPGGSGRRR